jgi:dimethylamine/trimethylamine dehydrogenase
MPDRPGESAAMSDDSRFDILFEPVRIGPVTAPNRFYQTPHCTGMGHLLPHALAEMPAVKAEGGWGVINTEYCSIHPTSGGMPHPFAALWDADDVRNMALMTENVHAHGALPAHTSSCSLSTSSLTMRAPGRRPVALG